VAALQINLYSDGETGKDLEKPMFASAEDKRMSLYLCTKLWLATSLGGKASWLLK
jgi:hypothetical protein